MPRPRQFTEEMVFTTIRIPREMAEEARRLGVNMSAASRDGIQRAIDALSGDR